MTANKGTFWAAMSIVLLFAGGLFLVSGNSSDFSPKVTGVVITDLSGDSQIVKMHVEGSKYVFEPSTVKVGVPVRIEADTARMPGCSRSVIGAELGIRKTFTSSDNYVQFVPDKAGSFYIACSMNMYSGTLTVLESDGSESDYVQDVPTGGGTCGGGGCGCSGF